MDTNPPRPLGLKACKALVSKPHFPSPGERFTHSLPFLLVTYRNRSPISFGVYCSVPFSAACFEATSVLFSKLLNYRNTVRNSYLLNTFLGIPFCRTCDQSVASTHLRRSMQIVEAPYVPKGFAHATRSSYVKLTPNLYYTWARFGFTHKPHSLSLLASMFNELYGKLDVTLETNIIHAKKLSSSLVSILFPRRLCHSQIS